MSDTNSTNENVKAEMLDKPLKEYKILIVDDDKLFHKFISKKLSELGFTVLSADNPYLGLEMAMNEQPLLIILDIILPETNGDIVIKFFKGLSSTKNIPVIILLQEYF